MNTAGEFLDSLPWVLVTVRIFLVVDEFIQTPDKQFSDGENLTTSPACVNRDMERLPDPPRISTANGMNTVLSTQADLREDLFNKC